ncbi:P-loop containing protein [Zalerion maritima]|uniref:P-loop containing protein n=1 Tax=Zalerion maritima TaxID=339359 RepID=A0AAD5WM19_9PEZI|nr:P-loop containing protein [Zalerion maritima]
MRARTTIDAPESNGSSNRHSRSSRNNCGDGQADAAGHLNSLLSTYLQAVFGPGKRKTPSAGAPATIRSLLRKPLFGFFDITDKYMLFFGDKIVNQVQCLQYLRRPRNKLAKQQRRGERDEREESDEWLTGFDALHHHQFPSPLQFTDDELNQPASSDPAIAPGLLSSPPRPSSGMVASWPMPHDTGCAPSDSTRIAPVSALTITILGPGTLMARWNSRCRLTTGRLECHERHGRQGRSWIKIHDNDSRLFACETRRHMERMGDTGHRAILDLLPSQELGIEKGATYRRHGLGNSSFKYKFISDLGDPGIPIDVDDVLRFLDTSRSEIRNLTGGKGMPIAFDLRPIDDIAKMFSIALQHRPIIQRLDEKCDGGFVKLLEKRISVKLELGEYTALLKQHSLCVPASQIEKAGERLKEAREEEGRLRISPRQAAEKIRDGQEKMDKLRVALRRGSSKANVPSEYPSILRAYADKIRFANAAGRSTAISTIPGSSKNPISSDVEMAKSLPRTWNHNAHGKGYVKYEDADLLKLLKGLDSQEQHNILILGRTRVGELMWTHSADEAHRLLSAIMDLDIRNVRRTVDMNRIRRVLEGMAGPLRNLPLR